MMNNKIYIFLTFALLLLAFVFISGCGKYVTQYSAPMIINRYPGLGVGGIGSNEAIWLKFSKRIDTTALKTIDDLNGKIFYAPDMTATLKVLPGITPEITWSEDETKLTLSNVFFVASPESRIHMMLSKEAIEDINGLFLPENTDLWDFTLSGLSITNRYPTYDAPGVPNDLTTIEVTFNNPLATIESYLGPSHTAGSPTSFNILPLSNSNRTISIEVSSWAVSPGVVEVTYEAEDIFGNVIKNGQLIRYNIIP